MQRGRLLIIVAVVLILISIIGIVVVMAVPGLLNPAPTGTDAVATPDPNLPPGEVIQATPDMVNILSAVQDIQRGQVIPTEAIGVFPWPRESFPPSAITDTAFIVGSRARYAIGRGEPIFSTSIITSLTFLPDFGSDAAVQIPVGFVAIAMPYDKRNGAALAIRDGDTVNVLVSWSLVDIDQEFQTLLPNKSASVKPATLNPDGSIIPALAANTAPELLLVPLVGASGENIGRTGAQGTLPFYVVPSEQQRGRLVSQAIIQNAKVLRMGQFQDIQPVIVTATPSPTPVDQEQGTPQPPPPPPTATPEPDIITLIVSPQDAIVLDYVNRLRESYPNAVRVTFTLRAAGDTTVATTESVTLQYMFTRFTISLPAKLDYGLDKNTQVVPAVTPFAP